MEADKSDRIYGWICPRCGRSYSPQVNVCPKCHGTPVYKDRPERPDMSVDVHLTEDQ